MLVILEAHTVPASTRAPKDRRSIRILQNMISDIPPVLSLGARM